MYEKRRELWVYVNYGRTVSFAGQAEIVKNHEAGFEGCIIVLHKQATLPIQTLLLNIVGVDGAAGPIGPSGPVGPSGLIGM